MKASGLNRNTLILMFVAFALGTILSNLMHQARPAAAPEPGMPVLINYRGQDFTALQLPEALSSQYCMQIRQSVVKQLSILGHAALQIHIADHARRENLSFDEASTSLMALPEITDSAVEAYYADHPEQFSQPLFEVKEQIRARMVQAAGKARSQELMRGLLDKGDLIFFPDAPPPLCQSADPVQNANAATLDGQK